MLNRQKVLIYLLRAAGRPVRRRELGEWCHRLRNESRSHGGSAFYDFVTPPSGPTSFVLDQEMAKLHQLGHLEPVDDGEPAWLATPEPGAAGSGLDAELEADLASWLPRLLDGTGQGGGPAPKPMAPAGPGVYTAGYEGLSVDRFLDMLMRGGIGRIIDVRNNPSSRRYGFHKGTLTRLAAGLAIDYVHFPALGIPSARRRGLPADADRAVLFEEYERTTLESEVLDQARVADLMRERPGVLVCMEADPSCCHRSRLASRIARLTGLPVHHLLP
jgi:hypothetical protein